MNVSFIKIFVTIKTNWVDDPNAHKTTNKSYYYILYIIDMCKLHNINNKTKIAKNSYLLLSTYSIVLS